MSKDASILVVGAGCFGLSTAWHLARNGYRNVTVIDRHQAPSQDSAGHDLNKVFRTEYSDPLYARLAHEAREGWQVEPVLDGCYHETGYIFAVCGKSQKSVKNWEDAVANSVKNGVKFDKLDKPEDFRAKAPVMTGAMQGWKGVYNPKAGWTHAYNALNALTKECKRLGVKFVDGPSGTAKSVLTSNGNCIGILAEDGTKHAADKVIVACGAWLDSIIDTHGQSLAKCWCFIHIELTEEEAESWKNMPVINNRELGYLFEPDVEARRLKVAPHGVGYTHYVAPGKSFPRSKASYPSDGIPTESKEMVRELLRQCLPDLADRPFGYERMCWDADTPDAHFLITEHEHKGLYIAGGASAHGFKFLPNIGKYVVRLLEDRLEPELAQAWRWRPEQEIVQDTSRPDRPNADIKDLEGWMNERMARL